MKNTNDLVSKIGELSKNPQFVEEVEKAKTPAEAIQVLANYGVKATEEEISEVIAQSKAQESGELSPEELETVAGGINWWKIAKGVLDIFEGIFGSK